MSVCYPKATAKYDIAILVWRTEFISFQQSSRFFLQYWEGKKIFTEMFDAKIMQDPTYRWTTVGIREIWDASVPLLHDIILMHLWLNHKSFTFVLLKRKCGKIISDWIAIVLILYVNGAKHHLFKKAFSSESKNRHCWLDLWYMQIIKCAFKSVSNDQY